MFRLVASRSNSIRSIASCVDSIAARALTSSSSPVVAARSQYQIPTSSFPSSHQRQFSSSHDDFSPQKKHNLDGNDNESEILKMIDSHVKTNNIMLYMKGSPSQPMVSQEVVQSTVSFYPLFHRTQTNMISSCTASLIFKVRILCNSCSNPQKYWLRLCFCKCFGLPRCSGRSEKIRSMAHYTTIIC